MSENRAPVLRLRMDRYRRLVKDEGWLTLEDQARGIGIAQSTVSRTLAGVQRPGNALIAALLRAFPDQSFEDLFEVVDSSPVRKAS